MSTPSTPIYVFFAIMQWVNQICSPSVPQCFHGYPVSMVQSISTSKDFHLWSVYSVHFTIQWIDLTIWNLNPPMFHRKQTPVSGEDVRLNQPISSRKPSQFPLGFPSKNDPFHHASVFPGLRVSIHWRYPEMVGLFHEKSHLEMDDWGYPDDLGNPQITIKSH